VPPEESSGWFGAATTLPAQMIPLAGVQEKGMEFWAAGKGVTYLRTRAYEVDGFSA